MATDDERREVAERLRCAARQSQPYTEPTLACLIGADCTDIWTRLAGLIDPSDTSQGRRDTVACDREKLLALAEEMQGYADGAASGDGFPYVNAGSLWSYADRIREACGVVDTG